MQQNSFSSLRYHFWRLFPCQPMPLVLMGSSQSWLVPSLLNHPGQRHLFPFHVDISVTIYRRMWICTPWPGTCWLAKVRLKLVTTPFVNLRGNDQMEKRFGRVTGILNSWRFSYYRVISFPREIIESSFTDFAVKLFRCTVFYIFHSSLH